MAKYGYVRVSAKDQKLDRQYAALEAAGVTRRNIYADKKSGKNFSRPAYQRLMKRLRPGDLLIIKSIDRLGRNYKEIIEQWRIITQEKQADVKVLDMPLLDTTYCKDVLGTFIADLVLAVLSYAAQIERDMMLQRQAEGIIAAKKKGAKFGRPKKDLPNDFDALYLSWRRGELTGDEVAARCNMALGVLYRKLRESGVKVKRDPRPRP